MSLRFIAPSKTTSISLMILVFVASWINPIWPMEQALHCSLTVVAFGFLWWYVKKHGMNDRDFFLIIIFLCMHSLAARWLYSNIPYESWIQAVTGYSLSQEFGWTRNNFDRLVHFLYGFCITPATVSHIKKAHGQSYWRSYLFAIAAVMIASLWYEWFEWIIAMTLSPSDAEAYNGQQGDMWDAHKDMFMATIGSLVWLGMYTRHDVLR
jgi:putative membrane protein